MSNWASSLGENTGGEGMGKGTFFADGDSVAYHSARGCV